MQQRKKHQLIAFIAFILALGLISLCVALWIVSEGGLRLGFGAGSATATASFPLTARAGNATVNAFYTTMDADTQIAENTSNTQIAESTAIAQHLFNDYGTIPHLIDPGAPYSPYIKGKIVIIDQTNKEVENDNFLPPVPTIIPVGLFATTPAEVGTVIWISTQCVPVGIYSNGGPAFDCQSDITIIDRATATVVGRKHFEEYPPETIPSYEIGYGGAPLDAIAHYIASLPRK